MLIVGFCQIKFEKKYFKIAYRLNTFISFKKPSFFLYFSLDKHLNIAVCTPKLIT
jgi:hypothetical protein